MARIFRQTYTKPLPEGVEIFTRKGKQYARFKDGKGKTVKAPLSEDGNNVIRETSKWYIEYKNFDGTIRKVAGFKDRQATEQRASELERTAEHIRSGYKPKEHEQLNRPLRKHLNEFREYLLTKGTSGKQAQQVYKRALRIVGRCGFVRWSDIRASQVQNFLADLRTDKEEKRGLSIQTSNWYLQAIKTFCGWMVTDGRVSENPLEHLKRLNVNTDRRHDRRALSPEECRKLLAVTATGPVRWGMPAYDRVMLYRMALESGLRASEIKTLTVGVCELNSNPPVLIVKAAYSKHRREDIQPIPASLAQALRDYLAGRSEDELVFTTMTRIDSLAKMVRKDLETAGIPYRDGAGRFADFHALRHTYITNLARAGIHPKTAMDLARHSDINLTLARYSHTLIGDRAIALEALENPDLNSQRQVKRATGTDDFAPEIEGNNKLDDKLNDSSVQPFITKRVAKNNDGFLNRRSEVRVLSGVIISDRFNRLPTTFSHAPSTAPEPIP